MSLAHIQRWYKTLYAARAQVLRHWDSAPIARIEMEKSFEKLAELFQGVDGDTTLADFERHFRAWAAARWEMLKVSNDLAYVNLPSHPLNQFAWKVSCLLYESSLERLMVLMPDLDNQDSILDQYRVTEDDDGRRDFTASPYAVNPFHFFYQDGLLLSRLDVINQLMFKAQEEVVLSGYRDSYEAYEFKGLSQLTCFSIEPALDHAVTRLANAPVNEPMPANLYDFMCLFYSGVKAGNAGTNWRFDYDAGPTAMVYIALMGLIINDLGEASPKDLAKLLSNRFDFGRIWHAINPHWRVSVKETQNDRGGHTTCLDGHTYHLSTLLKGTVFRNFCRSVPYSWVRLIDVAQQKGMYLDEKEILERFWRIWTRDGRKQSDVGTMEYVEVKHGYRKHVLQVLEILHRDIASQEIQSSVFLSAYGKSVDYVSEFRLACQIRDSLPDQGAGVNLLSEAIDRLVFNYIRAPLSGQLYLFQPETHAIRDLLSDADRVRIDTSKDKLGLQELGPENADDIGKRIISYLGLYRTVPERLNQLADLMRRVRRPPNLIRLQQLKFKQVLYATLKQLCVPEQLHVTSGALSTFTTFISSESLWNRPMFSSLELSNFVSFFHPDCQAKLYMDLARIMGFNFIGGVDAEQLQSVLSRPSLFEKLLQHSFLFLQQSGNSLDIRPKISLHCLTVAQKTQFFSGIVKQFPSAENEYAGRLLALSPVYVTPAEPVVQSIDTRWQAFNEAEGRREKFTALRDCLKYDVEEIARDRTEIMAVLQSLVIVDIEIYGPELLDLMKLLPDSLKKVLVENFFIQKRMMSTGSDTDLFLCQGVVESHTYDISDVEHYFKRVLSALDTFSEAFPDLAQAWIAFLWPDDKKWSATQADTLLALHNPGHELHLLARHLGLFHYYFANVLHWAKFLARFSSDQDRLDYLLFSDVEVQRQLQEMPRIVCDMLRGFDRVTPNVIESLPWSSMNLAELSDADREDMLLVSRPCQCEVLEKMPQVFINRYVLSNYSLLVAESRGFRDWITDRWWLDPVFDCWLSLLQKPRHDSLMTFTAFARIIRDLPEDYHQQALALLQQRLPDGNIMALREALAIIPSPVSQKALLSYFADHLERLLRGASAESIQSMIPWVCSAELMHVFMSHWLDASALQRNCAGLLRDCVNTAELQTQWWSLLSGEHRALFFPMLLAEPDLIQSDAVAEYVVAYLVDRSQVSQPFDAVRFGSNLKILKAVEKRVSLGKFEHEDIHVPSISAIRCYNQLESIPSWPVCFFATTRLIKIPVTSVQALVDVLIFAGRAISDPNQFADWVKNHYQKALIGNPFNMTQLLMLLDKTSMDHGLAVLKVMGLSAVMKVLRRARKATVSTISFWDRQRIARLTFNAYVVLRQEEGSNDVLCRRRQRRRWFAERVSVFSRFFSAAMQTFDMKHAAARAAVSALHDATAVAPVTVDKKYNTSLLCGRLGRLNHRLERKLGISVMSAGS